MIWSSVCLPTPCFSYVGSLRWLPSLVAPPSGATLIKVGFSVGRLTGERELHPGFLLGTDGTHNEAGSPRRELVRGIRGMQPCSCGCLERRAPRPLTVYPNGGNFTAPPGNASCKCIRSILPYLHASVSSMRCMNETKQEWVRGGGVLFGGGHGGNLSVSFEACLIEFFCQVSLQGHTGDLVLEGIHALKKKEKKKQHRPESSRQPEKARNKDVPVAFRLALRQR